MSFKVTASPCVFGDKDCVMIRVRGGEIHCTTKSERQAVIRALQAFDRKKKGVNK